MCSSDLWPLVFGAVLLLSACAHDPQHLARLKDEIQALSARVAKLEAQQAASQAQPARPQATGWRSLGSWKSLRKSMSAAEVRALLGEPSRVMDGPIVFWFYPNDGRVALINDQVNSWTDPP